MPRPCFAWFLPCIHSARNVDTDDSTLSHSAKNDSKVARFEKILEETELDVGNEASKESVDQFSKDPTSRNRNNSSTSAQSESTPWIVKEKPVDASKPQDNGVVGLVGQVGSLHRQNENGSYHVDEISKGGGLFFEARSTPRWGHSSPVKADEVPGTDPVSNGMGSSNRSADVQQVYPAQQKRLRLPIPCENSIEKLTFICVHSITNLIQRAPLE